MFLNYKRQNVHFIPMIVTTKKGDGSFDPIEELKGISLTRESITLLPGVNEVTGDELKVIQFHCKDLFKGDFLEIVEIKTAPGPNRPQKIANTISEVPPQKVRELIKNCINVETLKNWMKDPRADVRMLVERRIKEIMKKEGRENEEVDAVMLDENLAPVED